MKKRAEIKAIAKNNFRANYWPTIGWMVLYNVIIIALAGLGVGIFFTPSMYVGLAFMFLATFFGDKENAEFGKTMSVGFEKIFRNVGAIILEGLLIFAWSLLFCIPGIIKAYAYAMTTYILADCPEVGAIDAITISRRMMKGHKWEYFVFNLSFIGWDLLNIVTLGLTGLFFSAPYQLTSQAGYYAELKKLTIERGIVTAAQFAGAPLDGSAAPAPEYAGAAASTNENTVDYTGATIVEDAVVSTEKAVTEAAYDTAGEFAEEAVAASESMQEEFGAAAVADTVSETVFDSAEQAAEETVMYSEYTETVASTDAPVAETSENADYTEENK